MSVPLSRFFCGRSSINPETPREMEIEKNTREKTAQEYAVKVSTLKRSASDKDDIISFLRPPKMAKDEYMEQTPAKFVFKCRDGDIQIPEYGLLQTDFYYQERIVCYGHNCNYVNDTNLSKTSESNPVKTIKMGIFTITSSSRNRA